MKYALMFSVFLLFGAANVFAQAGNRGQHLPKNQQPTNPCPTKFPNIDSSCQAICAACTQAQYVVGDWSMGKGFWADCVVPIMTGKSPSKPPPAGIQLPQGLQSQAATCNSKNPNFWRQRK